MQEAIRRTGTIVTPRGATVQLAMKVAIAVGDARRFVVGDPEIQLIDVLAGRLMDDLAEAEHHAQKGEIVLDQSAMESLVGRIAVGDLRVDENLGRACAPLLGLLVDVEQDPGFEPASLPEDLVRPWLLPAVYERLRTGRGEFLAELRPAIPVFVRFGGIDYDNDADAITKLDEFVRAAQRVLNGYGGNVLQLTLGDKGAYLYGVFGSPLAHEDDAARASAAVLDLRDLEKTTAARDIQVGVTHGHLRSGTYGHDMRRTFVCLGDAVNLAARLMSAAPAGRIYVADAVREAAGDAFIWERLPDLTVKGKSEPVVAWSLNGSLARASRRKTRFELELVGRRRELGELEARHAETLDGHGRMIGVAAEAGMGKSRLVAELVRNLRRGGNTVVFGECQSYGTKTPYFVWREIWRRLFGLEDGDEVEQQIAALERRLAAVDPGLVARAPLLSDVVGLSMPDSDLTRSFDAKLRKASLEDLLAAYLRARAQEAPLVVVLEDCHWIDELSRDLLAALARVSAALPVLFVLAYRPAAEPGGGLGIGGHAGFSELALERMEADDVAELVRSKMEQLVGGEAAVSDALVELVAGRSDGNPFYVEELLNFIVAQGVDVADATAVGGVLLPESLHTLVLSRLDAAAEKPRRTMKVASVVGRVFTAQTLPGAYEELGDLEAVIRDLDALRTLDLVALDREADQAWMFKHVVTQEVAYESLPFALRAILHGRVGAYLERTLADDLDRHLPLLEHHYWRSDQEAKKREYLWKAAEAAQALYANNAAIAYFERLIPLLEGAERIDMTIRLAEVLQLVGEVPRAEEIVASARGLAVRTGDTRRRARCDHSMAESARRVGRFHDAMERLAEARAAFEDLGDDAGVGDVLQVTGTVNAQRGDIETARRCYRESLEIRERLGDTAGVAALTNNLGIVAMRLGEPGEARRLGQRALDLYRQLGDQRRICSCEINLGWMDGMQGDHASALGHCDEAIRLAREVGDRLNIAIAENNRGDGLRDLGRLAEAAAAYATAARTYRDLNDRAPMMALLEDVAVLASRSGRHGAAFLLLGAADALREVLGSPRSAQASETLEAETATSAESLGEAEASRARETGRTLDFDRAVELTLESAG